MSLRPYQQSAIDEIRNHFATGTRRVLLHLATGGGKTHIFSHMLKTLHSRGKRGVMVVRGRKLVDQAHQRLAKEGVWHGVHMNGHWLYRPHEKIQICSIDTLVSRQIYPEADLVVVDEAHMATSTGYRGFLKHYQDRAFILGVTATPYTDLSLRHVADVVVKPISVKELIGQGFLVPPRYFCPRTPDLRGVKISAATKDYVQDQLSERMDQAHIIGDVVDQWKKLGEGRPTVVFAVTVEHSKHVARAFEAAGIPAAHMEAGTPDEERQRILKQLERGEVKVVSNVGILCTGVDLPYLGCLVLARPTRSYSLYIQQLGRGTRPAAGKSNFLVLDHADNVRRHGFIDEEPPPSLDGKFEKGTSKVRICQICYIAYVGRNCPECGVQEKNESEGGREILSVEGELQELEKPPLPEDLSEAEAYHRQLQEISVLRGYAKGWVWHQLKMKYGAETASAIVYGKVLNPRRIPPGLLRRKT